jgi:hypothetical protein
VRNLARILLAVGALTVASCSDDGGESTDTTQGTDTTATEGTTDLSTYDDLDALTAALTDAGYTCVLDYEGLVDDGKTVSLCTLVPPDGGPGSQATLTIWDDVGRVAAFVGSGAPTELTVFGLNWTMDLRDAAVAAAVAEDLGGATG